MRISSRLLSCLLPCVMFACSAQKGQDYAGESLAAVRGNVNTASAPAPAHAKVIMVWNNFAKNGDTSASIAVTATGTFPANFTMDIVSVPPVEQRNDFTRGGTLPDETRVGVAAIYAVDPAVTAVDDETQVLGLVEDYVVVYAEHDVSPGTFAATFLGGTLSAGFHLMKVDHVAKGSATEEACYASAPAGLTERQQYAMCHPVDKFDKLHEAEQGFSTEVTLKLAPEDQLNFPNYN